LTSAGEAESHSGTVVNMDGRLGILTKAGEMNKMFVNWKTTTMGLVPLLTGAVETLAGLSALMHLTVPGVTVTGDPFSMITTGLPMIATGVGLVLARDWDVTSEKSGAK
jgi:hypothetical protein